MCTLCATDSPLITDPMRIESSPFLRYRTNQLPRTQAVLSSFRLTLTMSMSSQFIVRWCLPASNKHTHTRARSYIRTRARAMQLETRRDRDDDRDRSDRSRKLPPRRRFSIGKWPLYFSRRIGNVHTVSSLPEFSGCYQVCEAAVCCASLENPYFRPGDAVRGYRSASARSFVSRVRRNFKISPAPPPCSSRVEFRGDPGGIVLSRHVVPVSRYPRNERPIGRRFSDR